MRRLTFIASLLVLVSGPLAFAQDGASDPPAAASNPIAVTSFVSLGSPTSSRIGAAVSFAVAPRTHVEMEAGYTWRDGGLNMSVGLLYDLPRLGRVTPYLAAGIGLDEYTIGESHGDAAPIFEERVGLSVNAGGGLRVPVTDTWGLRTDARWSNGLARRAPERWRIYNGVTFGTGR